MLSTDSGSLKFHFDTLNFLCNEIIYHANKESCSVLIITDSWKGNLAGVYMTSYAFSTVLAKAGNYIVTVGLIFFAFTTILGWNYYGERCTEFLFGVKGIFPYKMAYILIVASGAFLTLDVIWVLADIVNGLMAIPNLIALLALRKVVAAETGQYFEKLKAEASNPAELSKFKRVGIEKYNMLQVANKV